MKDSRVTERRALRFAWLVVLAAIACARGAPAPHLVIVTLDTTRADHLGAYGYFRDTSPRLDAFASQALVFDRAVVPMATTLPTHVSFFTATHPLEHGVLYNTTFGSAPFVPTPRLRPLAEVAKEAGWRTAAFVSAAPLKRGTGIEHGFERFDEPEGGARVAELTTQAALDWLSGQTGDVPFLLWVHYFDAHWPYAAPDGYSSLFASEADLEAALAARRVPATVVRPLVGEAEDTRVSSSLYDGELRYQDAQLGRLLDALQARADWGRTLVVIAGDHGEGLGQHGEAAHGGTWDEQLRVPLLIRVPGEPPRRVAALVTAADVIPTLLGRVDARAFAPLLAQASGRDALAGGTSSRPVLSQDTGRLREADEYRFALTTERWKLFRVERGSAARHELFDLRADPIEHTDVAARHPDVTNRLAAALAGARETQQRRAFELRGGETPPATAPDPALREQLRALGYVDDEEAARP
jgi:arylsulfatase